MTNTAIQKIWASVKFCNGFRPENMKNARIPMIHHIRRLSVVSPAAILLLLVMWAQAALAATTLLPNGKQCFTGPNGLLVSGSINMFVPNTTTPKATWQDADQTALNTQPIQLDANGCATIYGTGIYRQQVYDGPVVLGSTSGTQIWDQPTTDTSAFNSVFWAGVSAGTPNIITIVDVGFNGTDGSVIQFTAVATNTTSATLNPSSYGAIPIVKDTSSGPVALTGGEIVAGNIISVVYNASGNAFHLLNLISATASASPPLCGATNIRILNDTTFPNSKITLTADQVVMQATNGQYVTRNNVSVSINYTTTGAGGIDTGTFSASTWYYAWVVDNGIAATGLGSISATAPTMPSGYSYKCRLGATQTDGSGNFFRMRQNGRKAQWVVTAATNTLSCWAIANGAQGTVNTTANPASWASLTVTGNTRAAPSTASAISITAQTQYNNNAAQQAWVAPNGSYGGPNSINPPPLAIGAANSNTVSAEIVLEATTIAGIGGGAGSGFWSCGYTDGVNAN